MRPTIAAAHPIVIPFELANHHVVLGANVDGHDAELILDTGSSVSAFDAVWAARAGVIPADGDVKVLGTGEVRAQPAVLGRLELGPISLRALAAVLVPMDAVASAHARPIRGTVGFDLFEKYVVEIDYVHHELRLHEPSAFDHAGDGIMLPLGLEYRVPILNAQLAVAADTPVMPLRLVLDLGTSSYSAVLTTPFVEKNAIRTMVSSAREAPGGAGVGGILGGTMARMHELRSGHLSIREPVVFLGRDHAGFLGSTFVDGTIGAPAFGGGTLILDYSRARAIVRPPVGGSPRASVDASGMVLAARATAIDGAFDHLVVQTVVLDTPASEARVRAGDRLLAVDEISAMPETIDEIRRALRVTGAVRTITVARDGETVRFELTLRELV